MLPPKQEYDAAKSKMTEWDGRKPQTPDELKTFADVYNGLVRAFRSLGGYEDSAQLLLLCKTRLDKINQKLEESEQITSYDKAKLKMNELDERDAQTLHELKDLIDGYEELVQVFRNFGDYGDSAGHLLRCEAMLNRCLHLKEEREQVSANKARIGTFLIFGLIGLLVYLVGFNSDFRNFLYGYDGILSSGSGSWWIRSLLAAVPLGVLTLGMGFISMILRKDSSDSNGGIVPFLLVPVIYIAFTINVSWEHTSGFWQTLFSVNIFLLIPNALVALPGFFFWILNEPF